MSDPVCCRLEAVRKKEQRKGKISNSRAERQTKSYGTGRKKFLFHNSVDGAKSSAMLYERKDMKKVEEAMVELMK